MAKKILTAKQEAFAQHYAKTRNGAESYRTAYNCDPGASDHMCGTEASLLLRDQGISYRIMEIADAASVAAQFGHVELFRMYAEMASADANELIGLRVGCCRYCRGEDFGYQWREREFLEECDKVEEYNRKGKDQKPLPNIAGGFGYDHTLEPVDDCPECRGEGLQRVVPRDTTKLSPGARLLYGGVKQTRAGLEILIADQQKARENLGRLLGAFKDGVRIDGSISAGAALVMDLRNMTPQEAAQAYQDFIAGSMAVK